jgi:hypothetical protein
MKIFFLLFSLLFSVSAYAEVGRIFRVPQLDADPASPSAEDSWILKTASGGSPGDAYGMLMGITQAGGSDTYEYSYRTKEATTVRAALA